MLDIKESISKIKSIDNLKTIIEYYGYTFKKDHKEYLTNCPFHKENTPSFKLKDSNKGAIYHCFGCGVHGDIINFIEKKEGISNIEAIKKAYEILGLSLNIQSSKLENFISFIKEKSNEFKDSEGSIYKYENTYTYYNLENKPIYLKNKYRNLKDKSKKTFITKAIIENNKSYKYGDSDDFNNIQKVIYNLPNVKKAISKGYEIYFVEGEKDADNLNKLGFTATTIFSKKWFKEYSIQLKEANIVFIGDTGEAGDSFKKLVKDNLLNICNSYKIVNLPNIQDLGNNKDVTDWLEAGNTKDDLLNVVNRSLNLLNKFELQQDFKGIYQTKFKTNSDGEITEIKDYLTNFNIINAEIIRNEDNGDQVIKLKIKSNLGKVSEIEGNARECFIDIKSFRKLLGIDYTFTKKIDELIRLQEWIIKYFISRDTINYSITGIRKINGQYVLVTNKGTLYPDGIFDTTIKAINPFHDIDFEGINILSNLEANKLAENLFNFNSQVNVYNTLGLGIAHMLNPFVRQSSKDNLPILQDIGESNSGKSVALTILRLLFNNIATPMSYAAMTDFSLQKSLSDTYLPIFIDEVKPSKHNSHKLNVLSNNIRAVTEGYTNFKGTKDQNINIYEIKGSLILTGEEEIEETAVKNRSNIVWYARSNFSEKGKKVTDYLKKSEEGIIFIRRLSKSLYLHILNNYNSEVLTRKYDIIKEKYNFEDLLESSREANTAVYTMMGLEILCDVFEELGVNSSKYINLKEASIDIAENIMNNVMEQGETGAKAEYEVILETIDHLAGDVDFDIKLINGVDYKETTDGYIAIRIPTIYDKLTKYYKTYKDKDEKLLGKNTFTKMLRKSKYVTDDPYKKVQFKKIGIDTPGDRQNFWKPAWAYLLISDKLLELDISNLIDTEKNNRSNTENDNDIKECSLLEFPY